MYHDLLGLGEGTLPRFVEQYAALGDLAVEAVTRYADDVRARRFPQERHTYAIPADELERFQRLVEAGVAGRRRGRGRRSVTGDELAALLADGEVQVLDVRAAAEYDGTGGYPCDPVQGHIPGAVNIDVAEIAEAGGGRARPCSASAASTPAGRIVCYCHSGSRSAYAVAAAARGRADGRELRGLVARVVAARIFVDCCA